MPTAQSESSKPQPTTGDLKAMIITKVREKDNEVLNILQTVLRIEGTAEDFDLSPMMLDTMFYFDNANDPQFVIENHGKYDIRAIAEGKLHIVPPNKQMYIFNVIFPSMIQIEITSDL